jgi:(2Fe-2S) ferredoxin
MLDARASLRQKWVRPAVIARRLAVPRGPSRHGLRSRGASASCNINLKRIDLMSQEPEPNDAIDPPPYFDAHIFVCCNRRPDGHPRGSCAARGSEALRDYMKVRVKEAGIPHARVNMAGCLDRCEEGPCLVIYPAGTWYRIETRADVDRVIDEHLQTGGRAEDLRLAAKRSA